ncbi:acyl-coenzyme A--6-aminopenicillanic acid acyl-transferase [Streptomyces sp. NPDC023723]|uniref:acyl-coenzyme A--6-aminopenicillanic acid acyl-transferase n=1 Tax=Streptomyces sp. NPDC023723 TaxID=3154323 RepID=UPI0033F8D22E
MTSGPGHGDGGDGRWAAQAGPTGAGAENWLTEEGRTPEGAARARELSETHLPELVPSLDRLAGQLPFPRAGTLLTLAAVRPFFAGCTQNRRRQHPAAELRLRPRPVRGGHRLLPFPAAGDRHAGSRLGPAGRDRGSAAEAVGRLRTLPVAIPQNVTLADHDHDHDRAVTGESTRTSERPAAVRAAGTDVAAMLRPPLCQEAYGQGLGTVYTARYRPAEGRVTYHWPGAHWEQSFGDFSQGERTVVLGLPEPAGQAPDTLAIRADSSSDSGAVRSVSGGRTGPAL